MAGDWFEAELGALYEDGEALELRGGLNFVGFSITDEGGYYTITYTPGSGSSAGASGVVQLSDGSSGFSASPWARNGDDLDLNGNAVIDVSYIAVGTGTHADSGDFRADASFEFRAKNAGAGSSRIFGWDGTDVSYGDSTWAGAQTAYYDAGATGFHTFRHGTAGNFWTLFISSGVKVQHFYGNARVNVPTGNTLIVSVNDATVGTWSATGLAMNTLALSGVTTLNGARVAAPTQGTAITTTATINIANGAKYDVSSAGGAYAITLSTSGSPVDGDTVTLRTTAALANAITVTNGGTGGGNLGPDSGTIPAGMHAEYYYYYDGTATAWKYGGRQRTQ